MRSETNQTETQVTMFSWASLLLTSLLIIGCGTDPETETKISLDDGEALASRHVDPTPSYTPVAEDVFEPTPVTPSPSTEIAAETDPTIEDTTATESDWAGVVPAEDPHAAYLEAESLYYRGQRGDAIPHLRASIAARPSFVPAHYLLGLCSRAVGELHEAEAAFRETVRLDDTHLRAYVNLGRVMLDADRPADARDVLQSALDIGLESGALFNVLGLAHMASADSDAADEAFSAAIALDPTNVYALNNLGLLFIRHGRFEDAVEPLTSAAQMDNAPAYVHNNLGLALERTGQLALSVDAFAAAREAGHAAASISYERVRTVLDDKLARLEREADDAEPATAVAVETGTVQ